MPKPPPAEHPALDLELPAPPPPPVATRRAAAPTATARPVHAADEADAWWLGLTADRRRQIHAWVDRPHTGHDPMPGQLDALDHLVKESDA